MLKAVIEALIKDVTFPSEADYPLEYFESTHLPEGKMFAFSQFLDDLSKNEPKYNLLAAFLLQRTTDQQVIHSGNRYYIIGLAFDKWVGACAQAVET